MPRVQQMAPIDPLQAQGGAGQKSRLGLWQLGAVEKQLFGKILQTNINKKYG
jgi:hypothetical protein